MAGGVLGFLTVGSLANADQLYSVTNLGTLDGIPTRGQAVNDSGQVTGSAPGNSTSAAFIYSGGTLSPLGALSPGGNSQGNAINNNGWVVGASWTNNPTASDSFLYNGTTLIDLGAGSANAINNSGVVVGNTTEIQPNPEVITTDANGNPTSTTQLPLLPGATVGTAEGINNSGEIVGHDDAPGASSDPFYPWAYQNGVLTQLTTDGGATGTAVGINSSGQIVGFESLAGGNSAVVLWNSITSNPILLHTISGPVNFNDSASINDAGYVVDSRSNSIWYNGVSTLISDVDGDFPILSTEINNENQITGYTGAGAVLLSPVPEPASLGILAIGVMGFFRRPTRKPTQVEAQTLV